MASEQTKDSRLRRQVLISTLSNYAGQVFTLGVWFFLTPFMVRQLGDSLYGLWILVASLVAYGNLFDFGIATAVVKYTAEYQAQGKIGQARSLVATALWFYAAIGLIVIVLGALLALVFPILFNVPPEQYAQARWLVLLSGITLGVSLPCSTAAAVLSGLQRFDLNNLIGFVGTTLSALAIVGCISAGWGVIGLAVANLIITLAMQIPTIGLIYRVAPALQYGWRGADRQLIKTVARFSSALFMINVASQIQTKTDEIVIGALLPVAQVTPYSIARRLSELPQTLTDQFMKVLLPLASQLHAEDDQARLRALYLTSTRLTLAVFVPLAVCLTGLARAFLTIWMGPAYANSAYLVFILVAASLLDTSQWPAAAILQGMNRHRRLAWISLGSAIANLGLSLVLVWKLGVAGAALGTLIPTAIESLCFVLPYVMRVNRVSLRTLMAQVLFPVMLPILPMALALYGLGMLLKPTSLIAIAILGGTAGLLYWALYLGFSANTVERQVCQQLWSQMRVRLQKGRE